MPSIPYVGIEDGDSNRSARGWPHFVTYRQTVIGVAIFVVVVVAVGLAAGLTAPSKQQNGNVSTSTPATTVAPPKYPVLAKPRLPTNIKPKAYNYQLDIDMTKLNFIGFNIIQIEVKSSTNIIIVHVKGIHMLSTPQVGNSSNFNSPSRSYKVVESGNYKPNSYYYIVLQNNLSPGTYYVRFNFTAQLSSDLLGLYKYQYTRASDRQQM